MNVLACAILEQKETIQPYECSGTRHTEKN